MLHSRDLEVRDGGRCQLPGAALGELLQARRKGRTRFSILVADQLAPAFRSYSYCQWGGDIASVVSSLLCYCSPNLDEGPPIRSMAPDERDWIQHPPAVINNQWRGVLEVASHRQAAAPGWNRICFEQMCLPIDRRDFYTRFPKIDFIIHTQDSRPYANLELAVDPSRSPLLGGILDILPVELIVLLSMSGHSHRLAVVPRGYCRGNALSSDVRKFVVDEPVEKIVQALSQLWLPDEYPQLHGDVVQRALSVSVAESANFECALEAMGGAISASWLRAEHRQRLTRSELLSGVNDFRTLALVEASNEAGSAFLLVNGISGHCGGF